MWGRLSLKWSCSNDLTPIAPMIRDYAPTDQNMQKEDYSDKNIAKYQNEADDFYCPECGNCDFCFLFKDAKHEFILPLEQIVFCLFVCKEEHVIVDTYPNFWMLMFNSYPSLQNLITENNYEMRDYERKS